MMIKPTHKKINIYIPMLISVILIPMFVFVGYLIMWLRLDPGLIYPDYFSSNELDQKAVIKFTGSLGKPKAVIFVNNNQTNTIANSDGKYINNDFEKISIIDYEKYDSIVKTILSDNMIFYNGHKYKILRCYINDFDISENNRKINNEYNDYVYSFTFAKNKIMLNLNDYIINGIKNKNIDVLIIVKNYDYSLFQLMNNNL